MAILALRLQCALQNAATGRQRDVLLRAQGGHAECVSVLHDTKLTVPCLGWQDQLPPVAHCGVERADS